MRARIASLQSALLARTCTHARAPMNSMYLKNPMTQAMRPQRPEPQPRQGGGRRIQVRRSGVHGKGVFALRPFAKGETHDRVHRRDHHVDGGAAAPSARPGRPEPYLLLPHRRRAASSTPTSAATRRAGSTTRASRTARPTRSTAASSSRRCARIKPGEELYYDYGLIIDEPSHAEAQEASSSAAAAAATAAARCSRRSA